MGQRSQIFVRYEDAEGKKHLIARYYQWNYGERMISRVAYTMSWLKAYIGYDWEIEKKCARIMDVNFDYHDVYVSSDMLEEYAEFHPQQDCSFKDFAFVGMDNNDGKALIDIKKDGAMSYAFLDYDNKKLDNAEAYLKWDSFGYEDENKNWKDAFKEYVGGEEIIKFTQDNMQTIFECCGVNVMDEKQIEEFMNCDYSKDWGKFVKKAEAK